jgi:uroporphyrinogen-III synthase
MHPRESFIVMGALNKCRIDMRILVTRPASEAERTARRLVAAGHEPVLAPVMVVRATGKAPPPGRFDAVLMTSGRAVADEAAASLGALDLGVSPLFAVGRQTAEAARQAGFRDVRIADGDAAPLLDLMRLTLPRPARLLYLAGQDRKPTLEAGLAAAGYALSVHETYAAEAVAAWPAAVLDQIATQRLAACLHYSRRSAALALQLAEAAGVEEAFLGLVQACLSADAAAPLRAAALRHGIDAGQLAIAERPDEASLFALLPGPPPAAA